MNGHGEGDHKKRKRPREGGRVGQANGSMASATTEPNSASASAGPHKHHHHHKHKHKHKHRHQQDGQPSHAHRQVFKQHVEARRALPIWAHRHRIVDAVRSHRSTILVAETGSGKSTQVPQFLVEAGFCKALAPKDAAASPGGGRPQPHRAVIACTQPRRVAAMTVAERVAEEMGTRLGHTVGYAVRFDDKTSAHTVVKYVTDGVLLREAMADPLLSHYAVVVLDEAHERSLQTDILFGLIRRAQRRRPDLRVVVMSATLEVDLFKAFFDNDPAAPPTAALPPVPAAAAVSNGADGGREEEKESSGRTAVVRVEGRQFPVEVFYCEEAQEDVIDAAFLTVLQIHEDEPLPGDILVFLSGQEDIEALAQLLDESADQGATRLEICPLFAALPQEQQLKAFQPVRNPATTRKVILATNIAETSVTINGIRHVVDAGWVKVRRYVASTGLDSLRNTHVAKAQAQQRAGRAGREAPGSCYRLYTEEAYEGLAEAPEPEIQRVNLAQVVLQLMAMGIEDPQRFDYLSPPAPRALARALETLLYLGCVAEGKDAQGRPRPVVTPHGRKVAELPLDPIYAHLVLLAGERMGCLAEALTAVAMLSAENVLYMPSPHGEDAAERRAKAIAAHRALAAYEGDVPTLVNVYERWLQARRDKAWCWDHFVNARALEKAHEVRQQLALLVQRQGLDPTASCGNEKQVFLRCLAAGLFLNIAKRQPASASASGKACYKTLQSGREVAIHPSSVLHGRNPPPPCLVYTEVLTTSRAYIRGATIADVGALQELVPQFFGRGAGGAGAGADGGGGAGARPL